MNQQPDKSFQARSIRRFRVLYAVLVLVFGVFIVRAFYVQVIRYGHYREQALADQLKQYEIPAARGIIKAHDGDKTVSIVLNQTLYTIYADPSLIKDASGSADKVARVLGGDAESYQKKMQAKDTRYVVLSRRVSADKKRQLLAYKLPGIGAQEQAYRTYPQGSLAAQLLGFVDASGTGEYGIEQALNKELSGTPGELRAVTDINGVPLAANSNNIDKPPVKGNDVTLTIDVGIQKQLESILQAGIKRGKAQAGSALILDVHSGAVKAMANYPSYDPSNYAAVTDPALFQNAAVSHPIEVGSTMKTLTTAAALDQGVVNKNTTYYDPSFFVIDGFRVKNIEEDGGAGRKSLDDLLNLSLNTGATWLLMQMGGGELNAKSRAAWYDYMTNHFRFGKETGIEQGYEATGYVPTPQNNGAGINLTYANTAFGQAMTATALQMGAALAGVVNGGTYYQPHLVDQTTGTNGKATTNKPKVVENNVIAPRVSQDLVPMMQYVVDHHYFSRKFDQKRYVVGGKTGTAQIAKPTGGYYDNLYNGTYAGFVGGDRPQYVIVVFVIKPHIPGYAGSQAAQPIFGDLAHMLIDDAYVMPRS